MKIATPEKIRRHLARHFDHYFEVRFDDENNVVVKMRCCDYIDAISVNWTNPEDSQGYPGIASAPRKDLEKAIKVLDE